MFITWTSEIQSGSETIPLTKQYFLEAILKTTGWNRAVGLPGSKALDTLTLFISDGLLGGLWVVRVPTFYSCPHALTADSSGGVGMDSHEGVGDVPDLARPWQIDFPLPTEPFPSCLAALLSHVFTPVPFLTRLFFNPSLSSRHFLVIFDEPFLFFRTQSCKVGVLSRCSACI